ncbi:MAG: type IV secretion system protein [Proteobacteria bacterium]|nr:type IV secretion system protein [Pseudomonadota bacterium]
MFVKRFFVFIYCFFSFLQIASSYNSMMEFETKSTISGGIGYLGNVDNCFSSGKALFPWEVGDLNNTCIPTVLGKDSANTCSNASHGSWSFVSTAGRAAVYMSMMGSFPIGSIIALIAIGIEYIIMIDICTNAYIVAPHEYINFKFEEKYGNKQYIDCKEMGAGGDAGGGPDGVVVYNDAPKAFNAIDVPFFYHCNPRFDPIQGAELGGTDADEEMISRTWGYMGGASAYCIPPGDEIGKIAEQQKLVGKVVVHYINGWDRFWGSDRTRCNKGGSGKPTREEFVLTPGQNPLYYKAPAHYHPYYTFGSGKVQLCVATPYTLLPIKVGCTYVPPPNDELELDDFIKDYLSGTRCFYFISGREDLRSLGKAIDEANPASANPPGHIRAVSGFLRSDLHITSTIIGCIQDLLIKVFINKDPNISAGGGGQSFFQIVQEKLKQIVYAILVLYIALVGIKIMSSAEMPKKSELIMYIIKFALVLYFGVGDAWYSMDGGKRTGLYPAILNGSQEITDLFMSAQNDNDPAKYCNFEINGRNIFSEVEIPVSSMNGLKNTIGFQDVIKMTTWDLIDCKVANYLNLGSCKYTMSGMIGAWIITASFLLGISGFLLSIVSFIYCFMFLLIIFKFVHIFIMSMFVITILVLLSPILFCFGLFEFTKGIAQKTITMIIGYMLYPALLMAFVALMLSTFDYVFYGDLDLTAHGGDIKAACDGNNSMFCKTYDAASTDPCSYSAGGLAAKLTTTLNLGPLGEYTILKDEYRKPYFDAVLQLMLFAFLFYLFSESVSSFIAILVGVQDLGGMARGGNALGAIGSGMASAGKFAMSAGTSAGKGIMNKIKSGGGSKGGGSNADKMKRQ